MTVSEPGNRGDSRARLLLVAGIAVVLAALVGGVLLFSGDEDPREFEPAPAACIEGWNSDGTSVTLGQHQATAHRYAQIQVTMLTPDGVVAAEGAPGAACGIVFAASALDSEAAAAALVQRPAGWKPLSDLVDRDRLAELQIDAQEDYNALLSEGGTIDPL